MKKTRYLRAICSVLCVIMVILCPPLGATATEAAASIESPDDSENMSTGNANTAATDNELQSVGTAPYALGLGEKTFAELSAEEKNKISHRGEAVERFAQLFARQTGLKNDK